MAAKSKGLCFLAIDMQEKFRPMAEKCVHRINTCIADCRKREVPIILTQHGHKYSEFDTGQLGQFWGVEDMIAYGSEDWKLLPELKAKDTDLKIDEKRRYDAFFGTPLDGILRKLQVDTVVISGVMTNLCCETTARSAFNRDYRVIFLSDGCETAEPHLHQATLANMQFGFAEVIECNEFRKKYL